MEKLLEDISFSCSDTESGEITIDANYVNTQLQALAQDQDLSRFIL